jgi:TRAP-type mannitol/chloroaromatic compound transport system permease large subunit
MEWIILLLVVGLVLLNVPIGFALALTAGIAMLITGIDLLTVPLRLFHGADNFPLLAIPLFVLTGNLMNASGLSYRLMIYSGGAGHDKYCYLNVLCRNIRISSG